MQRVKCSSYFLTASTVLMKGGNQLFILIGFRHLSSYSVSFSRRSFYTSYLIKSLFYNIPTIKLMMMMTSMIAITNSKVQPISQNSNTTEMPSMIGKHSMQPIIEMALQTFSASTCSSVSRFPGSEGLATSIIRNVNRFINVFTLIPI